MPLVLWLGVLMSSFSVLILRLFSESMKMLQETHSTNARSRSHATCSVRIIILRRLRQGTWFSG